MQSTIDYYKILKVRFDAEKAEIISSYKRLSKIYHPDVSSLPNAREVMVQLNVAYNVLRDDEKRAEYDRSLLNPAAPERLNAVGVMTEYFDHLMRGNFEQAYLLLCPSDRRRVDLKSFVAWRSAVSELYSVREFTVTPGQYVRDFMLSQNTFVPAESVTVDVLEKDHASGRVDHYCFSKYVVSERAGQGVYLGYRDLSEILKVFDHWAKEREKDLMQKHWATHLQSIDRLTGLLSREGFLQKSKLELYRARRYKRPAVIACFSLKPLLGGLSPRQSDETLEAIAEIFKTSLRLTDIPAYLGGNLFAVLYSELKNRHAGAIVDHLLKKAEAAGRDAARTSLRAASAFEPYAGGPIEPYLSRLIRKLS